MPVVTPKATHARRPLFDPVTRMFLPSDSSISGGGALHGHIKEGRAALVAVVVVLHLYIFFIKWLIRLQ